MGLMVSPFLDPFLSPSVFVTDYDEIASANAMSVRRFTSICLRAPGATRRNIRISSRGIKVPPLDSDLPHLLDACRGLELDLLRGIFVLIGVLEGFCGLIPGVRAPPCLSIWNLSPPSWRKGILKLTPERALELVVELENLIELGGRADPPTLKRIEEITLLLEGMANATRIIDDKLRQLRSWAMILFNERKSKKCGRGADDIKNILRVPCISLRQMIHAAIEITKKLQSTSGTTTDSTGLR